MTRNEAARFLLEADNVAIVTHRRPDGDTLAVQPCCAAVCCSWESKPMCCAIRK